MTKEVSIQWISVEERLPETTKFHTTFLVSVFCEFWKPTTQTMMAKWENTKIHGKAVSRWLYNDRLFPSDWKIIGWAELPEPMQ